MQLRCFKNYVDHPTLNMYNAIGIYFYIFNVCIVGHHKVIITINSIPTTVGNQIALSKLLVLDNDVYQEG
jgi:hypothetical protein